MKTSNALNRVLLTTFVAVSSSAPAWAAEGDCVPTPASSDPAYGSFVSLAKATGGLSFSDVLNAAISYYNANEDYPITSDLTGTTSVNLISVSQNIDFFKLDGIKGTYTLPAMISNFGPILQKTCFGADVTVGSGISNAQVLILEEYLLRWDATDLVAGKTLNGDAQGLHNKRITGAGSVVMSSNSYSASVDVSNITASLSIPLEFSINGQGNFVLRPAQIGETTFSGTGTTTVKGAFTANQSLVSSVTSTLALTDSSVNSGVTLTVTPAQANGKSIGGTGTVSLDGGVIAANTDVSEISANVASSTGAFSVSEGATFTITAANASGESIDGAGATTISGDVNANADFTGIATTLNIGGSVNGEATLTLTSDQGNGRELGGDGTIAISAASSNLAGNTDFRGLTTSGFSFSGAIAADKTLSINAAQQGITVSGDGTVSILGTEGADNITAANISAKRSVDGLGGADTLSGSAAADTFNGGADNDTITGGAGNDRAVYSGALAADGISSNGSVLTVSTTADGSDTVSGVETLSFSNGDVAVIGNGGSIADLNAALAFSSTAKIFGVAQFNAATPFANVEELDAILARLVAGEGASKSVDLNDMTSDQINAVAQRVGSFGLENIASAAYALNAATAANMDDALTVSGILPDASYSALDIGRQLAVRNDLVANRGEGYSVSSADALFDKLVVFRTAVQVVVNAANSVGDATDLSAADFSTGGRIVAVRNAMFDLGSATLNGEAINVAQADSAINAFNALNAGGQAVILASMNAGGYASFTQLVTAANTAYPAAVLANLNYADASMMDAALTVAGFLPSASYSALDAGRQLAVRNDLVSNRPEAGYAATADVGSLFTKLVAFRTAVQVVVDAANSEITANDIVAADFMTGGRIVAVRNTMADLGLATLNGEAIDVAGADAAIAGFLVLNDGGRAVILNAINAGGFVSFTQLTDAAAAAYPAAQLANLNAADAGNIVSAMMVAAILPDAGYTALAASRQVDVQTDLLDNRPEGGYASITAADGLFGSLVSYRAAVQAAVGGADIAISDFTSSEGESPVVGRVVAVRNAISALGEASRSGDAVSIDDIDTATTRILALNAGGQGVMLDAMNDASLTTFASMIAAANSSYDPAAILANLNAADSGNIVSAMQIAGFAVGAETAYAALDAGRQTAVQNDMLSNRGSGFVSTAAAGELFTKLVSFRTAVQAVVNGANGGPDITAADFSSGGRMVAVYNAMAALGSATLNGEAIDAAGALASINTFNAMNSGGQASLLATINAGGFTSFTDLVNAATAGFPAAQLANVNAAADAAQMATALAIAGYTTDPAFLALEPARQSLVSQDVLRKRPSGEGFATGEAARASFDKSVAVYTNVKTVVDSANAGELTVTQLNGLYAALVNNGGSASGDPGTLLLASDVAFSIALQSALSPAGVSALNAAYLAYTAEFGAMGSLSQVIGVSAAAYGIDAADTAAFGLLEPARQDLVFANTGVGTNDSPSVAGLRFNNSVVAYTAVKTIVDNTNAGTATVANWQALSAAIVPFGTSIVGAPGTEGLQKRDVDFTVALLGSLTTVGEGEVPSGMAVLNAQLSAVEPDFSDLGAVMAAGTFAFFGEGATSTLTEYGQLVADRQALVFTDLGIDNTSPSQSGARFAALTDARLAIQIAVDTANANGITDADFITTDGEPPVVGKMVAVYNGIAAAEALGRTLNGDPAATAANAAAAINSFNVLNDSGRAVILSAINITEGETAHGSFTALAAAANAAYPTAVLANLNGADATNIVSAMTVAEFATGSGSAYASLVEGRQLAVQADMLDNRGAGFASTAAAGVLFDNLVVFRTAVQVVVDAANENGLTANDFITIPAEGENPAVVGRMVAVYNAMVTLGTAELNGEAIDAAGAAMAIAAFNALGASGKAVILDAMNVTGTDVPFVSFTQLANAASAQYDRAVGRDLIAAGLSSSNSVAQINQAVLYALDGEIDVDATGMDFTRLNAVAAGHTKVDFISGTMVLTNDVTVLDDLLANAAAGDGSTVNVDAAGMGPAKLTALSVHIAKVDSITNLTLTNEQTDGEITNLLTKATGALATATDMNPAKLSALGGGAASIASNGITGSLVVSAAVSNQAALFGKVAPADGSFVTIDAAYTVTNAGSITAYGNLKDAWSDAAIFDKVDAISNLALYSTEEAAQITALLGKSVASGAGMATAVATGMTVDQINAIAAEAALAKIAADGVGGTMSVTSLVNNLDNLLAKTSDGANVEVNASGFDSAGKGVLSGKIAKVDSIWNLSLDSNEDATEIGNLLSKAIDTAAEGKALAAADASSMAQDALTALGAGASKIAADGVTGSLAIDSTVGNLNALLGKTSAASATVSVNAAKGALSADDFAAFKGVLAFNADKVDTITNLSLASSEDADEITALLSKVAAGSALVDASSMGSAQFNALGASTAIGKIQDNGITGTFTITNGVTYIGAVLGKTSVAGATVTVNASGMNATQLNDVGNNADKVDTLLNVTVFADASLSDEALTDLMSGGSNIIVIATGMSPTQLNIVAQYAANIAANGVGGTVVLNSLVTDSTLDALLEKTDEGAAVQANAASMTTVHLTALSDNIAVVDTITNLTLTSAQAAGEITNLLTKTSGALAVATGMDAAKLNALAATASIAKIATDGISGTVLLTSDVTNASISSLMTKTPVATTVRVNGSGMLSATLQLLVTLDSKIDSAFNLALSNDLTTAELSNLLGKSDAASATVNATNMDSAANGDLSVIGANIAKIASAGISGSVSIDSRLSDANIGAVLSKIQTAASFVGTTVSIDATGMSADQLSSIAAAVNALPSATASGIYAMDNLTLTSAQGSSVISGLILITNPGEASVVATGMLPAQLSGLGVYGAAIGSITGTVNITSGVSAAAITAIMNTSVASGAFVNVDPTGFLPDQLAAYNTVLTTQALMVVNAELAGSTSETFVKAGETVVIRVEAKNLAARAVGAQGRVNFDSTKLSFVRVRSGVSVIDQGVEQNPNHVSASNFMPTTFPGTGLGSASGQSYVTFYTGIDYSDNANIGETSGLVAEIEFLATADGFCKLSDLASLNQSFVNRLVTAATPSAPPTSIAVIPSAAMEVSALKNLALTGVPAGVASGDSVDDIFYYADAGTVLGTVVTDPGVTAANNCSSRPVLISITYPDTTTGSTWPARFPVGTSRVVWSSSDEAGNAISASRDIVIRDKQLVTVDVDFGGSINAGLSYSQSIRFRLSSGDVVNATVSFAGTNGTVRDVEIPVRADYTCIAAKDGDHTLAHSLAMPVVGTKYVPSSAFSLRGGDSNDDNVIDILDFGIFVADRTVVGSPAKDADSRSNFDRNAVVSNSDFAFISLGFLISGDSCGGGFANGDAPIARISVKELRRRGLGELAQADLNGDGWVDQFDIALAAEGRYRNNPEPQADDAEGMENPNW